MLITYFVYKYKPLHCTNESSGYCQVMVIGTHSTPTRIPNFGCGEDENFIQCKAAQLWYSTAVKTAQLQNSSGARPLSSQTALLCFSEISFSQEVQVSILLRKGKLWFPVRGELACRDRSPHLWSQRQISALNPLTLIGPKALSNWSELHSSDWVGKASILLVEIKFRKPLQRQAPVAEGSLVQRQAVQYSFPQEVQFV